MKDRRFAPYGFKRNATTKVPTNLAQSDHNIAYNNSVQSLVQLPYKEEEGTEQTIFQGSNQFEDTTQWCKGEIKLEGCEWQYSLPQQS